MIYIIPQHIWDSRISLRPGVGLLFHSARILHIVYITYVESVTSPYPPSSLLIRLLQSSCLDGWSIGWCRGRVWHCKGSWVDNTKEKTKNGFIYRKQRSQNMWSLVGKQIRLSCWSYTGFKIARWYLMLSASVNERIREIQSNVYSGLGILLR